MASRNETPEMPEDPHVPGALARLALAVVLKYVEGRGSLDAAVLAIRLLVELPQVGEEPSEADAAADALRAFGMNPLPDEQQARFDALNQALTEIYPDTA